MKQAPCFGDRWRPTDSTGMTNVDGVELLMGALLARCFPLIILRRHSPHRQRTQAPLPKLTECASISPPTMLASNFGMT